MGELAELGFMYRAASHGFGVARPYGDSHPYDILLQHGRRLLRIQVKSCFKRDPGAYHTGFSIHVSRNLGQGKSSYSLEEIDFIAAFVAPHDTWYLIPVGALGQTKSIRLYPATKRLKRRGGFYEQYREAWHLLKQEK
jgi:PD-(D/E)XK endonuclease